MKYVVQLSSNKEGCNYSDGSGGFNVTLEDAFVFDDDDKYVIKNYQGDAFLWARAHARSWAKQKKKALAVIVK